MVIKRTDQVAQDGGIVQRRDRSCLKAGYQHLIDHLVDVHQRIAQQQRPHHVQQFSDRGISERISAGDRPIAPGENGHIACIPEIIGKKRKDKNLHTERTRKCRSQNDEKNTLVNRDHFTGDKTLIGMEQAVEYGDPCEQQQYRGKQAQVAAQLHDLFSRIAWCDQPGEPRRA